MSIHRQAAALGALALALGTFGSAAAAQDTPAGIRPYRFTLEGYLSAMSFDRGGDASRATLGGYGARLMFNRSDPSNAIRTFFRRASFGVFTTFTSEQNGVSTQHFGVQGDVSIFPIAVFRGTLDPFVSLGGGGLNTRVDVAVAPSPTPLLRDSHIAFTLAPGAGARVLLLPRLALQGEVRDLVTFQGGTRHNLGLGAGLRLGLR